MLSTPKAALLALALAAAATWLPQTEAQQYPSRPVTMIVPYTAGGGTDVLARIIAAKMGEKLGESVVAVNRVGAGGLIGSEAAAKAAPDGYTMLFSGISTHVIAPAMGIPMNFDAARDFAAVVHTNDVPLLFGASTKLPFTDVKGLIGYLKSGQRLYLSAGVGSTAHVYGAAFVKLVGASAEPVHYKAMNDGYAELTSGALAFDPSDSPATLGPLIRDGRVRLLAVLSEKRLPEFPDAPTMAETGIDPPDYLRRGVWNAIWVPARTAPQVIATLNRAANDGLREPDAVKRIEALGLTVVTDSTPESTAAFINRQRDAWKQVAESTGLRDAVQKTLK
jgi:tripartite-type tricarboxylate transporter receptor subunit TctC